MVVSQVEALNSKALKNLQNVNFYILIWHRIVLSWFMSLSSTDSSFVASLLFFTQAENIIHVMYINFSFLFSSLTHSLVHSPFHRANGKLIHPEVDGVGVSDGGRSTELTHHFSAFVNIKKKRKQITWNI